jgi:diguanylate cyclase (GGDEF)-like protein
MANPREFKVHSGSPEQEPFAVRSLPQLPSWLQMLDLTEEDLTYIQAFLIGCFEDWLQQADGFPWLAERIELFHPDGTPIASSEHAAHPRALPPRWNEEILGHNAVGVALRTHRPAISRSAEHTAPFLAAWDCIAVPVFTRTTGILCAVLALLLPAASAKATDLTLMQAAAAHFRTCLYRRFEYVFLGGMLRDQSLTRREQQRRDILFEALTRFNDHMEVDEVLTEMMHSLKQLYPKCLADLFLSQDYRTANENVKQLDFQEEDMDLCKKAFLQNELCEQKSDDRHRLTIPLAGKQGVYGVLRLEAPGAVFDEVDQRFLRRLAGAAGAAFEKARLHEQSNAMVAELRLINELSRRLNSRLNKLQETIEYASSQLLSIFHADFCWILQFDALKNQFVVVSSNVPETLGERFAVNYGFIGVMWNTKEPIILPDYGAAYPIHSKVMADTNSKSLLASPLVLNGEIIGAVLISHREPNHFTYENYKLLQVLSVHLGLAVSNASLHAEVHRLVITDNVTGLFTRHYLNERISRKQQRDGSGALIVLDIDYFKQVNDTYGHQVGDEILQQVSHIIRTSIRDADIAARWGGEELAVYMPQLGLEQSKRVAERIRERVENETFPRVTVSCGVSKWLASDDKVSVESLFYNADMALYAAKRLGRNRVETDGDLRKNTEVL